MLLATAHLKADPDTLASAYGYSVKENVPYFVPDTVNPAVVMILSTYIGKPPISLDNIHHDTSLVLLDFHSTVSLHPTLRNYPIDTIIDHHIEGDLQAPNMIIDPIGATSTLIGEMYSDMPKEVAIAIGFGICDDTAGGILHATERDINMLQTVENITGKTVPWFMDNLKEAYLSGFKVDSDTRTYSIGDFIINIGQFRAPGALKSEKIFREVSQYIHNLSGDLSLYIISDPELGISHIVGKVENKKLTPLLDKLAGRHPLLSRKVDVLPYITRYIKTQIMGA